MVIGVSVCFSYIMTTRHIKLKLHMNDVWMVLHKFGTDGKILDNQRVVLLFSKDDWLIFYAPVIHRDYIFMPFRVCLNLFIIKHKQYVHKFNKEIPIINC
jgi:hypothetical protein